MIVLDASVVIAFLDPGDRHHKRAAKLLEEHATGRFRMHQLTIAEVLVGGVRTGRANRLFDDLATIGVATHQAPDAEPLTLAELRASTGLKMPDCCVLAVALHHSSPLTTFDEQLARVAQKLGLQVLR